MNQAEQQAFDAMRKALENHTGNHVLPKSECAVIDEALAAAKAVSEGAQAQEPVAWLDEMGNLSKFIGLKGSGSWLNAYKNNWTPLYTAPSIELVQQARDALSSKWTASQTADIDAAITALDAWLKAHGIKGGDL